MAPVHKLAIAAPNLPTISQLGARQRSVLQVSAGGSVSQYEDESGVVANLQISTMADGEVGDKGDEHSNMSEIPGDNGETSEPEPDGSAPLTPTRYAPGWLVE